MYIHIYIYIYNYIELYKCTSIILYIYVLFWNLVDWQKFVFPRLPNSHTPVHIYINHGRGPQNRMCVVSRSANLLTILLSNIETPETPSSILFVWANSF